MRYLSVAEIAKKWDVSERSVRNYCAQGRVNGAFLTGKTWNIPENAEKPERTNKRKDKPTTLLDILKEQKASKCSGGIYHKTQIELTYNSNHMEGSRLTHDQTRYIFETNTIGVEKEVLNVDDVIDSIFKYLPYGPQFYDEDTITDQPERAICAEIIREKALHALSDEVPHGIAVAIDQMKPRKGGKMYDIDATIVCERDSHKGIIIGKQGSMLKKIGTNARYEMEKMLDAKVNLKLWVKVKKDWRDSDFLIKNFGYREEE